MNGGTAAKQGGLSWQKTLLGGHFITGLTRNETLALFYIWDRPYKFVTFKDNGDGIVVYTEYYEGQFEELVKGVSGSVYECAVDPCIYGTHIEGVFNSDVPVRVSKETVIEDVFTEIEKRIGEGLVVLRRYGSLEKQEKAKISGDMVQAIHMSHLLKPGSSMYDSPYSAFIKEHFPREWSIAENMSDDEINDMINAWRRSVGV